MGRLTPEEAAVHPRRHQLTRGIGVEETIAIDVISIDAMPGDRLLLCSDGLSNELDADTLARLASAPHGLELAVERLVSAAKVAGGRDNISAILIELDEVNTATTPIRRTMSTAPPPMWTSSPRPSSATEGQARITWRVWVAALVLLAVLAGGLGIVHWYAYSTYYLGDDSGTQTIAVFRGQPQGFLWFQPVMVENTKFSATQLRPIDARDLAATISEPSLATALTDARFLHHYWELTQPTTTTTTRTGPATTTTTLKKR